MTGKALILKIVGAALSLFLLLGGIAFVWSPPAEAAPSCRACD